MKGVVRLAAPQIRSGVAYAFSAGLTGTAFALTLLIEPYLEGTVLPLFFMAVAVSATLWGYGCGLFTTLLGFVLLRAFFVGPTGDATLGFDASSAARLALYLALSSILVWMGGRQRAANVALREVAIRDALTGLYSRRFLMEALELQVATSQRTRAPLALLLIDVDHFKSVNDRLGHEAGDQVLVQVASLIKSRARRSDLVARFGGEEFVVGAVEADAEKAVALAEELRRTVEQATATAPIPTTISIGVAVLDVADRDAPDALVGRLLRDSDGALYRAKRAGRNRVANGVEN